MATLRNTGSNPPTAVNTSVYIRVLKRWCQNLLLHVQLEICPYIECEMLATLNINPLKCSGVRRLHFEVFGVIQV